jgi:CheY-like chemotaxis protein
LKRRPIYEDKERASKEVYHDKHAFTVLENDDDDDDDDDDINWNMDYEDALAHTDEGLEYCPIDASLIKGGNSCKKSSTRANYLKGDTPGWSSDIFNANAFPRLNARMEHFLKMNMQHEALGCMREMLYSSLYRGAGNWFTKRVLIVDDSKVMRNFLKRLLQSRGYATDEACNGDEALRLMKRRFYDCVFIDLEMPVMDGKYEF